jgi:hypothetical protein
MSLATWIERSLWIQVDYLVADCSTVCLGVQMYVVDSLSDPLQ